MATAEDSKAPFLRIPWAASLLNRQNTVYRAPSCRRVKASGEDSLYAETLKTSRTLRSCLNIYTKPSESDELIWEVSTLMLVGDGANGHPGIMHGGIVATILDEGMGMLQTVNHERDHLQRVAKGLAHGELPDRGVQSFTAYLDIKYLVPVQVPGCLLVTARYTKKEGRKEWITAEIKQRGGIGEDDDGHEIVCSTGSALFVEPKPKESKL